MVTIEKIYEFLKDVDPYDPTATGKLPVTRVDDIDYTLHVDMNPENEEYGHLWEWWLESSKTGFVDGGFEPANRDEELLNLASLIHGALQKGCGPAGQTG